MASFIDYVQMINARSSAGYALQYCEQQQSFQSRIYSQRYHWVLSCLRGFPTQEVPTCLIHLLQRLGRSSLCPSVGFFISTFSLYPLVRVGAFSLPVKNALEEGTIVSRFDSIGDVLRGRWGVSEPFTWLLPIVCGISAICRSIRGNSIFLIAFQGRCT